jgi:hypothetical protein
MKASMGWGAVIFRDWGSRLQGNQFPDDRVVLGGYVHKFPKDIPASGKHQFPEDGLIPFLLGRIIELFPKDGRTA